MTGRRLRASWLVRIPSTALPKGLPKQPRKDQHHAALPYVEVAEFIEQLRDGPAGDMVKLAFEFAILTAARTSEVLGVRWHEITGDIWTVPADRMKAARAHRVPLSGRCIEILDQARSLDDASDYIFSGRSPGKPLSNMSFLMTLRRMDLKVTSHGFRSAFRDWAAERTNFSREVCEMALAHAIRDKTEAAYRRGDLFEKRRELMAAWSRFVTPTSADVITLEKAQMTGSRRGNI